MDPEGFSLVSKYFGQPIYVFDNIMHLSMPPGTPPPYGHGSGFDIASYQSILRYAVKSSLSKGSGFDHRF